MLGLSSRKVIEDGSVPLILGFEDLSDGAALRDGLGDVIDILRLDDCLHSEHT